MAIQISRKCEYALRAVMYIAGLEESELYTAKNISTSRGIPLKFLEKILQNLVNSGLLSVTYGPKGGYRLARSADEITFWDVIKAVEGPPRINRCIGEAPECDDDDCSMKDYWKHFQGEIEKMFDKTTIAEAIKPAAQARTGLVRQGA